MNVLRDLLNRARWSRGDLHGLELTVVHRGAPGDQRTLTGARIVSIGPSGIEVAPEETEVETCFVPYHRFVSVRGGDGALLWARRAGGAPIVGQAPAPQSVLAHAAASAAGRERGVEAPFSLVLRGGSECEPLVLDGSAGEGGGQILRTALTLSMLTGRPFVVERIRAGRTKPGLMRQHLTCVKAAAAISCAELQGAVLGSSRLAFAPQHIVGGDYEFEVGSAGSTALVLQTIALPLALGKEASRVVVRGGTHARWAPIYPFLERAWLPRMQEAGADIALELALPGFYPAGGGEVVMHTSPSGPLLPLHVPVPGGASDLALEAVVAGMPEAIARRELEAAAALLGEERVALRSSSVRSPGPGNAVWLTTRDQTIGTSNVFSAIGELDLDPDALGRSVAEAFLAWRASETSVEEHLADQLMLPIAVAGAGSFTCPRLTLHARTNIEVIFAFQGRRMQVRELARGGFQVAQD